MNLGEYNMLKQWNTQINISPASEPKDKEYLWKNIAAYYQEYQAYIDISRAQYLLIFQKYQEPYLENG